MEIKLNKEQQSAYMSVHNGENVFLTGYAGTGKSYLLRYIYENIGKYVALTSTTGVSALILGGYTLHSYLGLGLGKSPVDKLVSKIRGYPKCHSRWRNLGILIIDEISMLSPELFEKIEQLARIIKGNDKPFGGIQLVLSGDFLQLPVVKNTRFCFESDVWGKCIDKIFCFTDIIRQDNLNFKTCLNEVRLGKVSDLSLKLLKSCVNKDLSNDKGIIPTRIYAVNSEVSKINMKEIKKLDNHFKYDMEIEVFNPKLQYKIDNFKKFSKIDDVLYLCKGAQVMLLYNLDIDNGLANGSRGVVVDFVEDIPEVMFMNGYKRIIGYNDWDIEENDEHIATIFQIPLKLAYASTVHSTQGLSLDLVEISFKDIFEYGQAYVALSRVKNIEGLRIIDFSPKKIMAHPKALEYYKKINSVDK